MRLRLWLVLILAFSVGMCCALAIRYYHFEATPAAVQAPVPTVKILFAKQTIPSGVEISADFVVFQEVPLSEVPTGALTSFAQVSRRQSTLPIPAGYPIFEDLLLSQVTNTIETTFVPTGSQIVTLDVVHLRHGDKVFLPKEPLATMLSADQHIDIRVIPHEAQGKLTEKKNELLRTFGSQDIRNSGELVLENIPIHQVQRQSGADDTGSMRDLLKLILEKSEADKLTAAAKKGQVRVLVRQDQKTQPQPVEVVHFAESSPEIATQSPPATFPLAQSMSLDSSFAKLAPSIPAEHEHAQRVAPAPADSVAQEAPPAQTFTQLPLMSEEKISQSIDPQQEGSSVSAAPEASIGDADTIRNDGVIAFGTTPIRMPTSERPLVSEHGLAQANLAQVALPLLAVELEQESVILPHSTHVQPPPSQLQHPSSDVVMGFPRANQTIRFLSPGNTLPERELLQKVESTEMLSMVPVVMPSVPTVVRGRAPAYSPFERRIYTVLPEDFERSPSGELQAPQRLLKSSDSGTQTK